MIKIIESPREGMQGFSRIISVDEKVRYIQSLLAVGFDTVEIGSIVSARAIPQMADALEVLKKLDLSSTTSNRMFLAVSMWGAEILSGTEEITHISYPFSFSPTFLKLNVNSTTGKAMETAQGIINLCEISGKQPVIYISMAFGNPYGDPWSMDLLVEWISKLYQAGARIIPLSNVSFEIEASLISEVFSTLVPQFPEVEFGLHLHTANNGWQEKVNAAYNAGCRRFDGVIHGWGGCPMAGKEMLGNLKTENLLAFVREKNALAGIDERALAEAYKIAGEIFK